MSSINLLCCNALATVGTRTVQIQVPNRFTESRQRAARETQLSRQQLHTVNAAFGAGQGEHVNVPHIPARRAAPPKAITAPSSLMRLLFSCIISTTSSPISCNTRFCARGPILRTLSCKIRTHRRERSAVVRVAPKYALVPREVALATVPLYLCTIRLTGLCRPTKLPSLPQIPIPGIPCLSVPAGVDSGRVQQRPGGRRSNGGQGRDGL